MPSVRRPNLPFNRTLVRGRNLARRCGGAPVNLIVRRHHRLRRTSRAERNFDH